MAVFGFDLLKKQVLEFIEGEFESYQQEALGDSEIERLLFLALLMSVKIGATEYTEVLMAADKGHYLSLREECRESRLSLIILRQAQIEKWRVDFLISALDWREEEASKWKWRELIVECDGHDFHEKTKLQAARDRSRDRSALLRGRDIFRFTGSEIWRDPFGCADQITTWAIRGWPTL